MEQAHGVISQETGKAGKARRFSWWLGLGLFLGATIAVYVPGYFLVLPRLGDPAANRTARLVVSDPPTITPRGDGTYDVSWQVYNPGPHDVSSLDSVALVPLEKGLDLLAFGGIGHDRSKVVSTTLSGDVPADAAWQFQGLDGPLSGGRLDLGGPSNMTLGDWQESIAEFGKNYPGTR